MNNVFDEQPLVTVCCLAYNHRPFIKSALEGFVNQKTSFKYQVIVHDDASTDGTQDIIKEYETQYPEIIQGIYQSENQYSKGIPLLKTYIAPLIQGKYVATCEGDDYWIDEKKLQKQFEVMEANPNLSACVHNTVFWNLRTGKKETHYSDSFEGILPKELIFKGGSSAFHTSSVFMRKEYISTPQELTVKFIGDYPRAVYLALVGDIYYLTETMSVYRQFTFGSWSTKNNYSESINTVGQVIKMLYAADELSNHEYHGIFERIIREKKYLELCLNEKWKQAYYEYSDVVSTLSMKKRIDIFIRAHCPIIIRAVRFLKSIGKKDEPKKNN